MLSRCIFFVLCLSCGLSTPHGDVHRRVMQKPNELMTKRLHALFDQQGQTADRVEALIALGADVNGKGDDGSMPLHKASRKGDVAVAEVLYKSGADINAVDGYNTTPLHIARNREMVKALVDKGADVDAGYPHTPLRYAINNENIELAKALIENKASLDINVRDDHHREISLLRVVIKNNWVELGELMIEHGVDINDGWYTKKLQEGEYITYPLDVAFTLDDDKMWSWVELLVKNGARSAWGATSELYQLLERHTSLDADGYMHGEVGDTLLDSSVLHRDSFKQKAKLLARAGADFSSILHKNGYSGNSLANLTPLHLALGDVELVEFFIELGASANSRQDAGGNSLLHDVSKPEVAKVLLDKGADVNAKNDNGDTPLHRARDLEMAKVLLDKGADVNAKNNNGDTPLHEVVGSMSPSAARDKLVTMLLENKADVNAVNNDGLTVLGVLEGEGDLSGNVVNILMEHGLDPNVAGLRGGNTILHLAIVRDDKEMVQLALEHEADPNIKNRYGRIPLHLAKSAEIVEILLQHKSNPNAVDNEGNTPLIIRHGLSANESEDFVVIELLIKYEADINAVDGYGNPLLHVIVERGWHKYARFLAARVEDINATNRQGMTALHLAATTNDEEAAELLLKHEADINAVDDNGWTPIHHAVMPSSGEEVSVDVINLLIANDADLSIMDKQGKTAIDYYKLFGIAEIDALEKKLAVSNN